MLVAMRLREIAKHDSKFFLKSVYGPVNESWPAMSFTLPHLKTYLDRHYRQGHDFILLTGTSGKETEPAFRGRLLTALLVDLTKSYRSEEIVPPEAWRRAQAEYPGQWEFSLGVVKAWRFEFPPQSVDVLPQSYPLMGQYPYRGSVREIEQEERERILSFEVTEEPISFRPAMRPALTFQALKNNLALNQESFRIAELVYNRVMTSGTIQTRTAAQRTSPPPTELMLMVAERLRQHPLCCALCGGPMSLQPKNQLLQPSPDRKDSASGSYGPDNFQLVHLACNLAKRDATEAQFLEWLRVACGHSSNDGSLI